MIFPPYLPLLVVFVLMIFILMILVRFHHSLFVRHLPEDPLPLMKIVFLFGLLMTNFIFLGMIQRLLLRTWPIYYFRPQFASTLVTAVGTI